MSATSGWYPDPGGGPGLYRYWDGKAWSAATSSSPGMPPPSQGLVNSGSAVGSTGAVAHSNYGSDPRTPVTGPYGQQTPGQPTAYAQFQQQTRKKRSPVGWWIAGAALVVVIVVVAVIAIRAATGGGLVGTASGQSTEGICPAASSSSPSPSTDPADGRVHGGPVSYPQLGSPWMAPRVETRVPFGVDALSQEIVVESNYQPGAQWVASILVAQLQAGDGFFTPQQGSQIVVKCILGKFYGDNPVTSNVIRNQAATIDGHDAWIVESKLSFDVPGLTTKGERLLVAIVAADDGTSGLYYASIPDTTPQYLPAARQALAQLKVDG